MHIFSSRNTMLRIVKPDCPNHPAGCANKVFGSELRSQSISMPQMKRAPTIEEWTEGDELHVGKPMKFKVSVPSLN